MCEKSNLFSSEFGFFVKLAMSLQIFVLLFSLTLGICRFLFLLGQAFMPSLIKVDFVTLFKPGTGKCPLSMVLEGLAFGS